MQTANRTSIAALNSHLPWVALAVTAGAYALGKRIDAPVLGAQTAAILLSPALFFWSLRGHKLDRNRIAFLCIAALPVAFLLVSSLLSADPRHALLGEPPLWQGWVLWATALGWLCVSVAAARRRDLLLLTRFLAVLGTVVAVWMLAEAAGLVPVYDPVAGRAMALFDNSLSAAQFLTLTIAVTAAVALRDSETRRIRLICWGGVLAQLAALLAANARAAVVAVAVGLAAFGALERSRSRVATVVRRSSYAALAAFAVATAVLVTAWSGGFGYGAYQRADAALSKRLTVWTSAVDQVRANPTFGTGPSHFEALFDWSALSDGRVDAWLTTDEHSMLLKWLADSGFIGFAAFLIAAFAVAYLLARTVVPKRASRSVRALVAGAVALFVAMLGSWPDPLAVLAVSLLVGSIVSLGALNQSSEAETGWYSSLPTGVAFLAAAAAVVSLVALFPTLRYSWQDSRIQTYPVLIQALQDELAATRDVTYLEQQLRVINAAGDAAMPDADAIAFIRQLAKHYPPEAEGSVDIPLVALEVLWIRSDDLSADEFWTLSTFFARKGTAAAPRAPLWRYALARAAATAQAQDAHVHIDRALAVRQPYSAAQALRQWGREVDRNTPSAVSSESAGPPPTK